MLGDGTLCHVRSPARYFVGSLGLGSTSQLETPRLSRSPAPPVMTSQPEAVRRSREPGVAPSLSSTALTSAAVSSAGMSPVAVCRLAQAR